MPGPEPQARFEPFDCSGVLNEWLNPLQVGGSGLTSCQNLLYHRQGGWAKRPGASRIGLRPGGPHPLPYVSGFRWYRAFPFVVTQLLVWQQGQLLIGNSPNSLTVLPGNYHLTGNIAPDFCSMRDPQAANGNGADVVIITGVTLANGSFSTATIDVLGLPSASIATTARLSITVSDGTNTVQTSDYQVLPTDNPASIASNLVDLVNQSAAYLNKLAFPPFLGVTYYKSPDSIQAPNALANPKAIIHLGARVGGAGGNSLTVSITATDITSATGYPMSFTVNGNTSSTITAPIAGSATAGPVHFSGGGNDFAGPLRVDWNGGAPFITGLSYMAPNPFTGCATWHDHLWLWGDPGNPDTVFASDLLKPEAYVFMAQNGGMDGPNNGGYNIGPGDGDPAVMTCVPNGNSFYVFKSANIYQITGYDFQQGEYQFSVTPQVIGYGVPSRDCVDVLEGQYVFWSGKKFLRLAVGAYEPEHIGLPVALQEGLASGGDQTLVKVAAGDFQVQTVLTNTYATTLGPAPPQQAILLRSVVLFAVDNGDGSPDTLLVYDDEKTGISGTYAWSIWTGWNVGCFIKYGLGTKPEGKQDLPLLYFVDPSGEHIYQVGAQPTTDWGNAPIPWVAQTGWIDFGTPELIKNIHEFYLRLESTVGSKFVVVAIPAKIVPPVPQVSQFPSDPVTFTFGPALAPAGCEALNDLKSFIQAALRCEAAMIQFTEDGTADSGFELLSYGIDCNPQEAYQT